MYLSEIHVSNHFLMMKCGIQSFRDHCSGESLELAMDSSGGL